jgi:hypothetical protein
MLKEYKVKIHTKKLNTPHVWRIENMTRSDLTENRNSRK